MSVEIGTVEDPLRVALREATAGVPGAEARFWRLRAERGRIERALHAEARRHAWRMLAKHRARAR